jgi:hypothetical protein
LFIYLLPIYFRFDPRVRRYEKSFPFLTCSLYLKKYILSHIASWIICLFLGESLTSNDIPFWGHVRVHIFKGPIIVCCIFCYLFFLGNTLTCNNIVVISFNRSFIFDRPTICKKIIYWLIRRRLLLLIPKDLVDSLMIGPLKIWTLTWPQNGMSVTS